MKIKTVFLALVLTFVLSLAVGTSNLPEKRSHTPPPASMIIRSSGSGEKLVKLLIDRQAFCHYCKNKITESEKAFFIIGVKDQDGAICEGCYEMQYKLCKNYYKK